MALTKYTFSISGDFPNQIVNIDTLTYEIGASSITHALDYILTEGDNCDIWFKEALSGTDATSTLPAIVSAHQGNSILTTSPETPDGVPIVRADSRPLNTEVYFTMCGDSTGIGDGIEFAWDFSNNDNEFTDSIWVPSGFKAKKITATFNCPIWMKDGTMYFYDAPWGQNISMFVGVPAGSYYPNPAGSIPASMLGLSDGKMYAYTDVDLPYSSYVMRHRMYGSCPMGDELNAEGAALYPIPVGWHICGLIITPESDNVSKGYASLEMYRCHTMLLPGQTIESLHS